MSVVAYYLCRIFFLLGLCRLLCFGCCCASVSIRSFHVLFRSLIGLFPTYFPFISLKAKARSEGFAKLTKPKPLVFPVRLSRTTRAILKEAKRVKAFVNTSSFTSLPRSPQNRRWSFSGHSESVGSSQVCPAAFRGIALFFVSAFCSPSPLARAAFTLSRASGVMVCASL